MTFDHHRGGAGTPLVLLHGMQGSWRIWRPVIPPLEAAHDVYAPTLPGHRGGAELPDDAGGFAQIADRLESQLDDAGIATAHLAGNSLGGAVALELARRGRARSVVAISPAGGWRSAVDRERLILLVKLASRTARLTNRLLAKPALRRHLLRSVAEHGDRIPTSDLRELYQDLVECTAMSAVVAGCRRDGPTAPLTPIGYPVRIAWPQHDRTIPYHRYGAPLRERIPDAEVIMLPGVGHAPMYDDPTLVVQSILHVTAAVDTAAEITPSHKRGVAS